MKDIYALNKGMELRNDPLEKNNLPKVDYKRVRYLRKEVEALIGQIQ